MSEIDHQVTPYEGCTIVIFGASGDLAKKKLFPSLYQLYKRKMLPNSFYIVGYARTNMARETFIQKLQEAYTYEDTSFFDYLTYISGQYAICEEMRSLEKIFEQQSLNRVYYLSLPPSEFRNVCHALKESHLITKNSGAPEHAHTTLGEQAFTRVVFEKPFGEDYQSAQKLDRFISHHFDVSQVFCIDHYLGKEPVQNILFFRFANSIFENLWSGRYIDHIQISLEEDIRVEKRAGYFDSSGIFKDMVQSHALQVLALAMMEPPTSFTGNSIRIEKSKLLSSIPVFTPQEVATNVVRGQYTGYLDEEGVPATSTTETFVAFKTQVNNWRWAGMPVYIRTGKALKQKRSEMVVCFKKIPHNIFEMLNMDDDDTVSNRIVFRFQPDTFLQLRVQTKVPGNKINVVTTDMNFPYADKFYNLDYSNGYDRILYSALTNESSLFLSREELFAQWKFTDAILDEWKANTHIPLHRYEQGTYGPDAMNDLIQKDGRIWNEE